MRKRKTALFIGRFQPFHNGHLWSLRKSLEWVDKVIIGIGSSNIRDENNPWDYEARRRMVEAVVAAGGLDEQVAGMVAIPDYPDDAQWVREVERRAGEFDLVVSNNEWTLRVMRGAGYKTRRSGLYNREELEGVKIRELIVAGDGRWKSRVPEEVLGQIDVSTV